MGLFSVMAGALGFGRSRVFSEARTAEDVQRLVARGKLVPVKLMHERFGGTDDPVNIAYVTPRVPARMDAIAEEIAALIRQGHKVKGGVDVEYRGDSRVPAKLHVRFASSDATRVLERTVVVW
jgi:hypothetical protein